MKIFYKLVFVVLFVAFYIISCSDSNNKNPVAHDEDTSIITGYIYNLILDVGISDVAVHIVGGNTDSTVYTDEHGVFVLDDVQEGDYSITPSSNGFIFGPTSQQITAYDGVNNLDFMGITFIENRPVLAGRIVTGEKLPVNDVTLELENIEISDLNERIKNRHYTRTNTKGYYSFMDIREMDILEFGTRYKITPKKYDYVFNPDSNYVTINDNFTVVNFEAHNVGEPLFNITGQVIPAECCGFYAVVNLIQNDKRLETTTLEQSGEYGFYGLKVGSYSLEFLVPRYGDIRLEKDTIEINLLDKNIIVPDIPAFNRITDYTVTGRIVDEDGKGIDNTQVTALTYEPSFWLNMLHTDANGDFSLKLTFEMDEERTYLFVTKKEGFTFSPDTLSVQLKYIKGETETEKILPDIIGKDYSKITDSGYFPLSAGSSWTYARTSNDREAADFTVSISETVNHNNRTYSKLSTHGPWRFTDYRIEGNDVYAFDGEEDVLFLRFGVKPGIQWESGLIAGTYIRSGTFVGFEAVESPAGTFVNCARFETKVMYGETSYDSYDLWYASGVGLVKSVKDEVTYGESLETVVDVLKVYSIP